jgi:DNA-directed RNA polymerase subunit RPC12/RpoP
MNISTDQEQPIVCGTCGAVPVSEEEARLSWSRGIEAGRAQWSCNRCSREFVRSIESKLDPVWW